MSSKKNHNWHESKGFCRSFSAPASRPAESCWFRDQSKKAWSPKSDDSDPSFDSDEENVAMETDCHVAITDQRPKFVLKTPLLSSVMSSASDTLQKPSYSNSQSSLSGGSSKSLVVGRPMRSVGLKDIDLTKNARAEEIRRAKAANRRADNRHMISPSAAPFSYLKAMEKAVPSGYHRNVYGINDIGDDDNYGVIRNTPPPEYSSMPYDTGSIPIDNKTTKVIQPPTNSKVCISKAPGAKPILYSEFITDEESCNDEFITKEDDVIEITDDDDDTKVACTDKACDNTFDDWKTCREFNIEKKNSNRSSSPYFSDDDDDDDKVDMTKLSTKKFETVTSLNKSLHKSKPTTGTVFSALGTLIVVITVVSSVYLHFNPLGWCLESEFRVNLTGLEIDLKQEFYGQHLAMKVLLSSLKSHTQGKRNKPLVLSLHGWTGTGKNYVSGIIAKHLFKHGTQSKFIHKFIIPLHFPHVSSVDLYRKQLRQWIIGNVTKCNKGGLFIFDEMDKIPEGIVSVLKPFLDTKGPKSAPDLNRFVFLFLSNSGGKLMNQHVLEHYKQGHARETIKLISLEGSLHRHAETNPGTWYNELLKSEVIDYFVPFLPLERSHVKQCIRRDMRTKGYIILEKMVTEVTNEMSFFPQDFQLFSVAGCKKVSSKVDVAMG